MKNFYIEICEQGSDIVKKIESQEGDSILESLQKSKIYLSAVCGGTGRCGKCKIKIIEGKIEIHEIDRKIFSVEELNKGMRLACLAYPKEVCKIEVPDDMENKLFISAEHDSVSYKEVEDTEYIIGIDIGTTTLAIQLTGKESNSVIDTVTMVNRQRNYGADVISRIKASNEGNKENLEESIKTDLRKGLRKLLKKKSQLLHLVKHISIAGNTTMIHLLMGYSCKGLGSYPFIPENISAIETNLNELLGIEDLSAKVTVLPGISVFVGGDIVAGLLKCGFGEREEYNVFLDLGTNGEMAIGNREKILCTSTAAGPAFEGGNISCGVSSVEGAISRVRIIEGKIKIQTINDMPPVGICGTGVVELLAELIREKYIDENGLLIEKYFKKGFPLGRDIQGKMMYFTQSDIREIQMAKAAIRAGMEIMIKKYGVSHDKIKNVYLAGGFGFWIDIKKAVLIGLLPEEFKDRMISVGNSSLSGAVEFIRNVNANNIVEKLKRNTEEITLANEDSFQELYIQYLQFLY